MSEKILTIGISMIRHALRKKRVQELADKLMEYVIKEYIS